MEALSPTMEEGQVVRWIKAEGDPVSSGEIIAEIETDKATMELVARGDGTLKKILVPEGGTVPVGQVIAVIAGADEDIGSVLLQPGAVERAAAPAGLAGPGQAPEEAEGLTGKADPPEFEEGGRVKASPLARRMAAESGLTLAGLDGSGPGGRIVKRDVEVALQRQEAVEPVGPVGATQGAWREGGPDYEDFALTQIRKTIARRLVESLGPVPHFFLRIHVDMKRALEARERMNRLLEPASEKVSVNDLVIRATAAALRRHPEVNSAWLGEVIRRHNRVHIGVAVAVEDGLITPVVRDADLKGVADIAREVKELAARAREKRLMPEEYTGATFTVSNLGMFGIEEFTGIINPPEAAILAVGSVEEQPVVEDGHVVARKRMRLTLSCDHRVVDGAAGARFLATLRDMLEEPAVALL